MATPIIQITIGGQDVSSKINPRILKGRVERHDGGKADTLTLTLSNYDGQLAKPARGTTISVALGFAEFGGAVDRGAYIVQQVVKRGPAAEFDVTAHSADLKKTLDRNDKAAIASFNQLAVAHNEHVQQVNEEISGVQAAGHELEADKAERERKCGGLSYRPADLAAVDKERRKAAEAAASAASR